MHTYWMTYRLADDGHFVARNQQLASTVNALSDGARWTEPHTFLIFKSKHSIDEVATRLAPALQHRDDVLLLAMTDFKEARILGCPQQASLYALMPHAKDA